MADKPTRASGYDAEQTSLVRATCLYVATRLGDLMNDLVIVGGLVPSLIIDQEHLPAGAARHVGTLDLDIGLSVLLLDAERYKTIAERLRSAGFAPDRNERGNPSRQRWVIERGARVTVDFLIAPTLEGDQGGGIRDLELDFAAFIMPGLELAFRDQIEVSLAGRTITGESAARTVRVCGPGAFVVLKALAFRNRGDNKDAYDLYYVVRNFGTGVADVVSRLAPLLESKYARMALAHLEEDFATVDDIGPRRAAEFMVGGADDDIQADAVAFMGALLSESSRLGGAGE